MNKKYGALSVLNQIIPALAAELSSIPGFEVMVTDGRSTKAFRDAHGLAKDHHIDAYCIACSVLNKGITVDPPNIHYELRRFRRHDRAAVSRREERKYYLDGKIVAKNRNKRMDQKDDSLAEFRMKRPEDVGNLTVVKGVEKHKDPTRILPGAIFLVHGEEMVLQGRHGKRKDGQANYFEFVRRGNFTPRQCKYLSRGGGWQFI